MIIHRKTSHHVACGYAFKVVRSDGAASDAKFNRNENAVEEFLKAILQAEDKIGVKLEKRKPILMQEQDWIDFKEATHCHITWLHTRC